MPNLTAKDVLDAFMPKPKHVLAADTECEVMIAEAAVVKRPNGKAPYIRMQLVVEDNPSVRKIPYWLTIPVKGNEYFDSHRRRMASFQRAFGVTGERDVHAMIERVYRQKARARLGVRTHDGAYSELNYVTCWLP